MPRCGGPEVGADTSGGTSLPTPCQRQRALLYCRAGDSTSSSVEFTSTAVVACAVTRADNAEHTAVEFNMKMSGIRVGTK
jgi:hypothetical protein